MLDTLRRRALDVLALLVIALMLCIVVQVTANLFGHATLMTFDRTLPLIGGSVTINALMELQWHLLTLVGLLPVAIVWAMDRHVRVDFLYAKASWRVRGLIELTGHLVFTLPFLWFATQAGWTFTMQAFDIAERSRDGGLVDRYLIKAVIPAALAFLLIVVVADAVRQARLLLKGR